MTGSTRTALSSLSDGDVVVKRISSHRPPSFSSITGFVKSYFIRSTSYRHNMSIPFRRLNRQHYTRQNSPHGHVIDGSLTAEGASDNVSPPPPSSHHLSLRFEVIRCTHILSDVDGRRVRPVVEHFRHASLRRNQRQHAPNKQHARGKAWGAVRTVSFHSLSGQQNTRGGNSQATTLGGKSTTVKVSLPPPPPPQKKTLETDRREDERRENIHEITTGKHNTVKLIC